MDQTTRDQEDTKKARYERTEQLREKATQDLEVEKSRLSIWNDALMKITATNRDEKNLDETWIAYIERLLGEPVADPPAALGSAEVMFGDVIVAISKQITKIKQKVRFGGFLEQRLSANLERCRVAQAKKQEKAVKKVKMAMEIVNQDTEKDHPKIANAKILAVPI